MTFYLRRYDNNENILDADCWVKTENDNKFTEISVSVHPIGYANELLSIKDKNKQKQFILTVDALSELRGWLWEMYFMGKKNDGNHKDHDEVIDRITTAFRLASEDFGLYFVTD